MLLFEVCVNLAQDTIPVSFSGLSFLVCFIFGFGIYGDSIILKKAKLFNHPQVRDDQERVLSASKGNLGRSVRLFWRPTVLKVHVHSCDDDQT